jgi:single-strand DNA-binding protein
MSSLNQVNLIGNLGRDPEVLKSTPQGNFVRLTIATTKKYRNLDGESQEETQWHTVYLSKALGNAASSYLKKGAKIFVSGELRTTAWKDKDDKPCHSTAVYARDVRYLSRKSSQIADDLFGTAVNRTADIN